MPRLLGTSLLVLSSRFCHGLSSVPRPSSLKLYYFDVPFWRAEIVRLSLFLGDVPFEDIRDQKSSDLRAAGKLTFGAVPVLEVDGKILSQTQAMATYAAKLAGIQPADAWLQAKIDECINGCTDVTTDVGSTFRLADEEKIAARQAMIESAGRLTMHLGGLDKICAENGACGYAVGDSLTVADLAIWRLAGWLSAGVIDGIPPDYVISTFPAIQSVVETVDEHPKVIQWKQKFPKAYSP